MAFLFLVPNKNKKYMDEAEAGGNLIRLVHHLKWSQKTPNPNPEWSKFDTATTMSDNRGGLIKF